MPCITLHVLAFMGLVAATAATLNAAQAGIWAYAPLITAFVAWVIDLIIATMKHMLGSKR